MLWKMVIRPPRDLYAPEELGPDKFRLGKRIFFRRDIQLRGDRGVLQCSHFIPAKNPEDPRPCVVYLHGNCSSRLEVFDALPSLLPHNVTVFCLDLSGSGRSDGEFISLGYYEEKDLQKALEFLREEPSVSSIGLWGRSMGATTSIFRVAQDSQIAACVLDSAFQDLRLVAEELVSKGRFPLPSFMLEWALDLVRQEVSSRAHFDPLQLSPLKSALLGKCPALFGVAYDDTFVLPHHTQALHDAWGGPRQLRVFDGGHNGVRPAWFLEEAALFLASELQKCDACEDGSVLELNSNSLISCPKLDDPILDRSNAEGLHPDLKKVSSEAYCSVEDRHPTGQRDLGLPLLTPVEVSEFEAEQPPAAMTSIAWPQRLESGSASQTSVSLDQSLALQVSPCIPSDALPAPTSEEPQFLAGLQLEQKLESLGFDNKSSKWASRRSLSLEGALDSLSSQDVIVKL